MGSLLVSLGLESAQFKSGLNEAEKQMRRSTRRIESIGRSMQNVGQNLSIAITAPLTALGVASFKAASDFAELESAAKETFGSLNSDITNFAETTGDAMGRSTQEILNAANTFGIFFNQAAPTRKAAADLSKQFTILAQDLSSFFNVSPEEALGKLRSGLSGESEPLRDFGVFLNEATVQAKAFEMGLASTGDELTEQNKIMARAALIMEATTAAQGDVARTSDGTANKVRAAKAAFEELTVAIGQKLIPALTPLIDGLTRALNAFSRLPDGVQTTIVAIGALAAALGPVLFVMGGVTKAIAPLIAGLGSVASSAAATGSVMGALNVGMAGLRAAVVSLVVSLGPYALALAGIAAVLYLVFGRTNDAAKASAEYREQQEKLRDVQERTEGATRDLATATGQARVEAIANAKAIRQETLQYLANARAALIAARAKARQREIEAAQVRNSAGAAMSGGSAMAIGGNFAGQRTDQAARQAQTDARVAQQTVKGLEAEVKRLDAIINAPAPVVDVPKPTAVSGTAGVGSGGSQADFQRDEEAIQQRYLDELSGYMSQIASVRGQQARSAEEAAEYDLRGVELARIATLRAIENDADYNQAQKDRLKQAVENLAIEERNAIEFRKQMEIERELSEMAGVEFDTQRELMALQADVADTQAERKRLALDILKLEQEYRRNQLEMVVASQTASDAEKARAQAILNSLAAIEAGESAAANRANETDVERYLREANRTPEQMAEARAGISLDGLDQLINGLSRIPGEVKSINDAFNTMRDVFQGVIQDMLAALIRLQLQKTLTSLIGGFLGGGSGGATGFASVLAGADFSGPFALAGARAAGGPVSLGKTYLVGEKGPELFTAGRTGQIIPNHELSGMGGTRSITINNTFPNITTGKEAREASGQASRRMRRDLNGPLRA